jgi:hypothetical protein
MTTPIKYDGLTLTDAQLEKAKSLAQNPDVVAARKVITLYKRDDEGLALFRTQAGNMLAAITIRAACNVPLKKAQARYVNSWLVDANPMFRDFFAELNKAVGFDYIQGVPKP